MVDDLLKILSTIIMFLLADQSRFVELETFLKKNPNYYEDELLLYLKNVTKNKESLAIFYENKGEAEDIKEALNTWRSIRGDRAIASTLRILTKYKIHKKDFETYAKWILHEQPEQVANIFLNNDNLALAPEEVIEYLRSLEIEHPLVLNYLRGLLAKKPESSQSLHNTLAMEYINHINHLKSVLNTTDEKSEDAKILKNWREMFTAFLDSTNKYDPKFIIKAIKESWMMEETILLLVKSGQHDLALETYLTKGMDKEAEEFCSKQHPSLRLITSLFELYMKHFGIWSKR